MHSVRPGPVHAAIRLFVPVPIVGEGMSGAMVEQVMDAMSKAVDQRSWYKAAYEKIAARGGAVIALSAWNRGPETGGGWPRPGASPI